MALLPLLGLLLLLVAVGPLLTAAQSLNKICSTDTNYTANSAFIANLNRLLSSLPTSTFATGFFNGTVGSVPDRVYGLALCRGDVFADECRSCLEAAAAEIQQACPYRRSAVIWYDHCLLRYSNLRFFSDSDDSPKLYMWNLNNPTDVSQFDRQRDTLLAALVRYAAYNATALMFATGDADYGGDAAAPKIYGLVQCVRYQSADDCSACLRGIIGEIPNSRLAGKKGGRILKTTCNFRFEPYRFYYGSAMVSVLLSGNIATPPAAAPSPPISSPDTQGTYKGRLSLICRQQLDCSIIYFLLISLFWVLGMGDAHKISTVESLLFDLSTLRAATGNFSDQNKLGQGGFGYVYKLLSGASPRWARNSSEEAQIGL